MRIQQRRPSDHQGLLQEDGAWSRQSEKLHPQLRLSNRISSARPRPTPRVVERTIGHYQSRVRMSAPGYKQTQAGLKTTSALHPGADLPGGVAEGPFLTHSRRRCQVGPFLSDSDRPMPIVPTTHPQEEATGAPFQRGHVALDRRAVRRRRPQGLTANVYSGLLAARKVPE